MTRVDKLQPFAPPDLVGMTHGSKLADVTPEVVVEIFNVDSTDLFQLETKLKQIKANSIQPCSMKFNLNTK